MSTCQNPECGKEIAEGKKYCDEACLRKYLEIKKRLPKLASEENLWLGQDQRKRANQRKRAMETILKLAREHCPMPYKKFTCIVSYRTGLSLRKIQDDYLQVPLEIGLLKRKENTLYLGDEVP